MRGLTAFEAVMRTGTFAAAADELNLTPSAVSYRIKALEEFLGVPLFTRAQRQARPTDAGQEYYKRIGRAFEEIERATRDLMSVSRHDILFVHSAPTFATQWLMPRLSSFFIANPDLDVRVTATPQPADPERDDIDIDIRYGRRHGPGMVASPLCRETVLPLASPDLVREQDLTAPADLVRPTLIHSTQCLVQWRDWIARYAPKAGLEATRGPKFDRSFLSIGTARDGLGVCLESSLLAYPELAGGTLVPAVGDQGIEIVGHFLAVPRAKLKSAKVARFQNWLEAELQAASDRITPLLGTSEAAA
jgi:LysR family glycine cleavage system transcriptional activator